MVQYYIIGLVCKFVTNLSHIRTLTCLFDKFVIIRDLHHLQSKDKQTAIVRCQCILKNCYSLNSQLSVYIFITLLWRCSSIMYQYWSKCQRATGWSRLFFISVTIGGYLRATSIYMRAWQLVLSSLTAPAFSIHSGSFNLLYTLYNHAQPKGCNPVERLEPGWKVETRLRGFRLIKLFKPG